LEPKKPEKVETGINYYVLGGIAVGMILYAIGNTIEIHDATKLDLYEAILLAAFASASIFAFIVARRYWGSKIFGRAYLALGIGYACYFGGWLLWYIYQIVYQVENPYPYYPDISYFSYFPFALYHLRTNIHYFRRTLQMGQKIVIIAIPAGVTSVYAFFGLFPIDAVEGISRIGIEQIMQYDFDFYKEYLTGMAFVILTTLTFSYAMIGFQIFRNTILGAAWGLLLTGIALNTIADVPYYILELFGPYQPELVITPIWVAGPVVISYALYKHRAL
jgi:hypothetical protein